MTGWAIFLIAFGWIVSAGSPQLGFTLICVGVILLLASWLESKREESAPPHAYLPAQQDASTPPPLANRYVTSVSTAPVPPPPPLSPPPPPPAPPKIVTRTTIVTSGASLIDSYETEEREWTPAEDRQLISLYGRKGNPTTIATAMRIDQKQVAIRLARVLFNEPDADLEDETGAMQHHKRYTKQEIQELADAVRRSVPLLEIAKKHERTPLGVAWKIINEIHFPIHDHVHNRLDSGKTAIRARRAPQG